MKCCQVRDDKSNISEGFYICFSIMFLWILLKEKKTFFFREKKYFKVTFFLHFEKVSEKINLQTSENPDECVTIVALKK